MRISPMGAVNGLKDYCGDKCGCGCTREQYDKAVEAAQNGEDRMKASGWEGNVWENCGWHWSLVKDIEHEHWQLRPNRAGKWECYSYGTTPQVWTAGYDTPEEAVAAAVDELQKHLKQVASYITTLTGVEL